MSEVQKTVEETPVVPTVEPAVETPATEAAVEAPKETTEEPTATPAIESTEASEPAKEEVKPASEGVLGHKGPGLVKGFRFVKRFFYFNEEATESKHLSVFHQNEKSSVANPIAAWATQTGKGLLFFTKRAEDKATPAGIFNLADVSDVTKEGTHEFLFKVGGHKHTFQAANTAERDSWVVAIEAQATEAKAEKETIISSEGYKAELEKLTKPAVVIAAAKKTEEETPAVAGEAAQEEPKEEKKEKATKSRSQSRKRASIFGSLLPKKEAEEKKEETPAGEETKAAEPTAEPSVEAPAPVVAETSETAAAPTEVAEPTAETPAETTESAKEEKKAEDKKAEKKAKRASIFGNFFQKVTSPSQEKSEKEANSFPTEETPVASTAPQLEHPVEEAAATPEAEASTTPAEAVETPTIEAPAAEPVPTPKEKRRTSFFGNLGIKKEKKDSSDNELTDGEAKESKPKKLGSLFRKPSKAVKLDKEEATATETEAKADAAEEAPAVPAKETEIQEAPKPVETAEDSKNVNVAVSTPVQAAA
ncbi:hypothetical protein DTO013E5_2873 [Penicillium roqueforti]|uniref:Pleckstrin homology-like domain n=1 Tax=Penicillium roqueforti (strain FM164) TaxID=1365484 RepID=W6QLA5_PENRF|nr:uncharacterized protein LCP9604111_3658 [Penicillium roqueforti]CDM36751.1 Pleckstrin homology-like domain [Penicillium roqueforti FM164]KAF9250142.1 hypothetical protein LCP9604111_3658 [Penicillium roqueforti]KAI1831452.1 hypothetical protein CBS147337_7608 [Penicillium roqueforti]KAI2679593.1 hypothetical protein CBS147355_4075 [Penicillium roqueforti]KAI2684459.1 hypothetical protein LCP963914a_5191 [Penicillium roqueforti]